MSQKAKHKLILDELERLNQTTTTPVYVPTLDAVIDFKEITIKQQKDIITSALDALLTNTVFNNTVNNIVKNNIITEPEHIQNLTTVDRLPIIISLRKQSLGADVLIKTDTDSYNTQCVAIVEKLPMSVSKQILKFIHTIKRYEEKFLTVKHDKTTTTLSIDATFFNNE